MTLLRCASPVNIRHTTADLKYSNPKYDKPVTVVSTGEERVNSLFSTFVRYYYINITLLPSLSG